MREGGRGREEGREKEEETMHRFIPSLKSTTAGGFLIEIGNFWAREKP